MLNYQGMDQKTETDGQSLTRGGWSAVREEQGVLEGLIYMTRATITMK